MMAYRPTRGSLPTLVGTDPCKTFIQTPPRPQTRRMANSNTSKRVYSLQSVSDIQTSANFEYRQIPSSAPKKLTINPSWFPRTLRLPLRGTTPSEFQYPIYVDGIPLKINEQYRGRYKKRRNSIQPTQSSKPTKRLKTSLSTTVPIAVSKGTLQQTVPPCQPRYRSRSQWEAKESTRRLQDVGTKVMKRSVSKTNNRWPVQRNNTETMSRGTTSTDYPSTSQQTRQRQRAYSLPSCAILIKQASLYNKKRWSF